MSSIHIPPIPLIKAVTPEGYPTPELAMWFQQLLQSRSAWTPYIPTTAHISAIIVNNCAYVQLGKLTFFRIGLTGTTDGTSLTVTLPFAAKVTQQAFAGTLNALAIAAVMSGDFLTLTITRYDGTTPANGTAVTWLVTGVYEAQ